jgi:hypothetical protein
MLSSSSRPDDRIWRPDLLAVLDWGHVWEAGQTRYTDKPGATWWMQATAGVNYYRADMPAKHLPGKTVRFESRDLQPRGDDYWFPRQEGGTAVWMFPGNMTRAIAMAQMKTELGLRVLVEVDDNYTVSPPMPGLSKWVSHIDRSGQDNHSYEAHGKIVETIADGVIVSTERLAEVYGRLHESVFVCPNSVDPADWPQEEPPHQPDGILRVGWAGSASHGYDLADIRRALDFAARQPDVEVVVMGQLDPGVKHRRIEWTESLAEYRSSVSQIDVMLCPLRSNAWSDCKSDVKALEAAMGGACAVVSRTEPFRRWWDGDAPGYVADSPKDFVKVVKHLVDHRDEVRETARLAREYALTVRNIDRSITAWREAIAA